MYLSSKGGKTARLELTARFWGARHGQRRAQDAGVFRCVEAPATQRGGTPLHASEESYDVFLRTLVTRVEEGCRLLTCPEAEEQQHARSHHPQRVYPPTGRAGDPPCRRGDGGTSPFPEIERHLEACLRRDSGGGAIKSYILHPHLCVYTLKGTRFCRNVGREHKSNGVYLVVDLQKNFWYQKCFDPDCRHFRSEAFPLPPEVRRPRPARAEEEAEDALMLEAWDAYARGGGPAGPAGPGGGGRDVDDAVLLEAVERYEEEAAWEDQVFALVDRCEAGAGPT